MPEPDIAITKPNLEKIKAKIDEVFPRLRQDLLDLSNIAAEDPSGFAAHYVEAVIQEMDKNFSQLRELIDGWLNHPDFS